MNIKLNTVGKILEGNLDVGNYIKIIDDSENTGGYLILTSDNINLSNCFDDWAEDKKNLFEIFEARKWIIEWLE
jgi:hypothetical protein